MNIHAVLADAVLLVHAAFVVFVVVGLVLVAIGGWRGWRWVRNGWFRLAHLGAIAVVTAQAWLGILCPLTVLEIWLRRQAGQTGYDGSFIQYWADELLYYNAPMWVFVVLYTAFAMLVVVAWIAIRPQLPKRGTQKSEED